jgi:hypothetical protein
MLHYSSSAILQYSNIPMLQLLKKDGGDLDGKKDREQQ